MDFVRPQRQHLLTRGARNVPKHPLCQRLNRTSSCKKRFGTQVPRSCEGSQWGDQLPAAELALCTARLLDPGQAMTLSEAAWPLLLSTVAGLSTSVGGAIAVSVAMQLLDWRPCNGTPGRWACCIDAIMQTAGMHVREEAGKSRNRMMRIACTISAVSQAQLPQQIPPSPSHIFTCPRTLTR